MTHPSRSTRKHRAAALLLASFVTAASAQQHTRPRAPAPPRAGAASAVPQLGDAVPAALLRRSPRKPCDLGNRQADPCATLTSGQDRITVAWDSATKRVTYLYSTTLDTDDDIRAGDLLEIDPDSPLTPFPAPGAPHRFVTTDWCDTDSALTGDSLWCAVMVPARPHSGKVVGFVQTLYLYLPEFDPEPMQRARSQARPAAAPRAQRTEFAP